MAFTPPGVDEIEQDQPKFTPPAPEDVDIGANLKLSDYDKYKLAVAHGATPEDYSELPIGQTPGPYNPNWDLVRAGGPVPGVLPAINKTLELVGDAAVKVMDIPTKLRNKMRGTEDPENPFHKETLEERTAGGQNIITIPHAPSMEGEGTIPQIAEGISNLAADTATGLIGRPQSAILLPLVPGEGVVGKLASTAFGATTAAHIPEGIAKAIEVASDPNATVAEKTEAIGNPLVQAALAKSMFSHGMKEGVPNASKNTTTAEIHGDVRPQPREGPGPLPQQEGGAGVFTPPKPTETQVPLKGEAADLLAEHAPEGGHEFAKLRDGRVMMADHDTGTTVVDPEQFTKWVNEDLKNLSPEEKREAVRSAFEHEDIHLKTDPEDAEPFWESLSPFEQYVLKRQYLKGQDPSGFTPTQLGFEAIRNRVERAMGLTRSDFIGLALHEKWTAQALDHLAHIVGKIRSLKDAELSAHQKSILEKVQDNIAAAREAVAAGAGVAAANQPFMTRKEEEPQEGFTRLYRGHEGDRGGAFWTTDRGYASTMGSQMESVDVPDHLLPDYSVSKQGSAAPGTYQLPEDLTKYSRDLGPSGRPVHDLGPAMTRRADGTPEDDLNSPLPPLHEGERVVLVRRPDGSVYRASYAGKQYDVSAGGKAMIDKYGGTKVDSVGRVDERGQWSHGILKPGEKIIKGFSPMAAVERSGGPEMTRRRRGPNDITYEEWGNRIEYLLDAMARANKSGNKEEFNELLKSHTAHMDYFPDYAKIYRQSGVGYPGVGADLGPSMLRKKGKAGEQEELFGAPITAKGIPGGEDVQPLSAEAAGAVETMPEQKIWPQEIDWQEKSEAQDKQSLPYRPITPSEAKNPAELKKFLTEDARKDGSDLPVSYTKRATVLFDKTDGSVHIVSTYPGDGTVRMVDPSLAGAERPNKPIEDLLHRYTPIASVLFRDARQNFHQKFLTMGAYNKFFGDIAKEGAREHFTGLAGIPGAEGQTLRGPTLMGVKESGYTGIGREAGAPEQAVFNKPKSEREPTMDRPNTEELKAISDYFGDNPPSDFDWFDKQFHRIAATGSRQMVSALRKMMRLEMRTHRGMSPGEALNNVLNQIYENLTNTETRKGFVTRTLAQISARAPEEVPKGGEPRKTGARELSYRPFEGPRKPPTGTGKPLTEGVEVKPTEMLSPAEREEVNRQVRMQTVEGSPTAPMSPIIYRQLANRQVPKERYTVTGQKSKLDDVFRLEDVDPDEVEDVIKDMEEEEARRKNPDLAGFTERELMSEKPERQLSEQSDPEQLTKYIKEKPGRTKEGRTGEQIALERAEASRQQGKLDLGQRADAPKEDYVFEQHNEERQLRDMAKRLSDPNTHGDVKVKIRDEMFRRINEYYQKYGKLPDTNPKGPAMLRRVSTAVDSLKEFMEKTGKNIETAGDLSDQLYRLKTSEKADYDLALPVIKSALKIIPEADRPKLMQYADEMQVLKKSDIKLTDAQQTMYETFIKPLLDDNQKMYRSLMRAGIPVGESTYLGRLVQDTHSLYSRLWRGTKQRVTEGSLLGQGASFFKRRVFKALEGPDGERKLIALVGDGKNTRVISYSKGKGENLGKMPPESLEVKELTPQQQRTQRIVEARRLQELDKLDKEEAALLKEKNRLAKDPNADPVKVKGVDDRLASINGDYAEVADKYPSPVFDIPRMWKDKNGKLWRFTDATINEIEKNTNTRYYQEPMSGVITQNLKLKQIYRANQFLEDLKNSEDFKRISRSVNERNVPEDWRTVDLPQFRGLRIEPRTADVLDLYNQESKGPALPMKYVTRLTNLLRNALFVWNPFVHEPNLLAHWFTARGIEWAKPVGYERMFKSGVTALQDVMTRSKFRDEALRAGAPLLRGMGNINKEILNLLQKELDPNPSLGTKVARALGYVNPLRAIRAFGDSLTWGTNEVLTLQLIRETMDRTGLDMHSAIAEVGKHMPNYRVPPRVLNSRLLSHVMRNPLLTLWGHYHYGALRSYGEMGKEIFSPKSTVQQRIEGLGRVATIGFLMALAYPTIDDIVNKVLKTKGLKMRRAGSATFPQNVLDVIRQKKTPEAALQSVATPSPVLQGTAELMFNRNLRTGLPVYERRLGTQTLKDLGSFAANKVSPLEEGGKVFGGKKSLEEFGLGLAGVTRTRADSAMARFGRMADNWMRNNPDESIREQYKRRTQDVFQESDYQNLRSAIIRQDDRAAQMAVDKLLKTRKPEDVARRIKQWQDSPFTGTRKTDKALIEQMTPEDLDLWYQAAQERLDIANGMMNRLVDTLAKPNN